MKLYIKADTYNDLIEKGYGKRDFSKLTAKIITDKNGHRRKVWVKPEDVRKVSARVKDYNSVKNDKIEEGDNLSISESDLADLNFKNLYMEGYYTKDEINNDKESFKESAVNQANKMINNGAKFTFSGQVYEGRFDNKKPYKFNGQNVYKVKVESKHNNITSLSSLYVTENDLKKFKIDSKYEMAGDYKQKEKEAFENWIKRAKNEDALYSDSDSKERWVDYHKKSIEHYSNMISEYIDENKPKPEIKFLVDQLHDSIGKFKAALYIKENGINKPMQKQNWYDENVDLYWQGKAPESFNRYMAKMKAKGYFR